MLRSRPRRKGNAIRATMAVTHASHNRAGTIVLNAFIAAMAIAAFPGLAAAEQQWTYTIDRSVGCENDCTGNLTVEGTVTVGALGELAPGDFVDWSIVINSENYANSVLDPSNSEIEISSAQSDSVVATPCALQVLTQDANSLNISAFSITSTLDSPYSVSWELRGGHGSFAQEVVTNAPISDISMPFDQGSDDIGTGGNAPIMTEFPSAAPECQPALRTYAVDRSVGCDLNCSGDLTAEGTLTISALGELQESDFVDWSITVNSQNHANTVMNPSNSDILIITTLPNSPFFATECELTLTIPDEGHSESIYFQVADTLSFPYAVNWVLEGGEGNIAIEGITNAPISDLGMPTDQGFDSIGVSNGVVPRIITFRNIAPECQSPERTYAVDRTMGCDTCSGDITAVGTITADGLGELASSDFVDWTLTLNSENHADTVLDPSNSEIFQDFTAPNGPAYATQCMMTITTADEGMSDSSVFEIATTLPFPYLVQWSHIGGDGLIAFEVITNAPNSENGPPVDQGFDDIGVDNGGAPVIRTLLSTAPECQGPYTYIVNRSMACTSSCSGNVTVQGTLTVDTLGPVLPDNFIDWSLTFNSPSHANTVLDPSNSEVFSLFFEMNPVFATECGLVVSIPDSGNSDLGIFRISDTLNAPYHVDWGFQGGSGAAPDETATNAPNSEPGLPSDQGVEFIGSGGSGFVTVVIPGLDSDGDGLCNILDSDDDGDGVADLDDADPFDRFVCSDLDSDLCEDCAKGYVSPAADGPDGDDDGICDAGDLCVGADETGDDDGDGVCNSNDVCPGFDDAMDSDGDNVPDPCDNCAQVANNQADSDGSDPGMNPVAIWHMEEGAGDTTGDVISGHTIAGVADLWTADGYRGNAIDVPDGTALNVSSSDDFGITDALTISLWVNPSEFPGSFHRFVTTNGYMFRLNGRRPHFRLSQGGVNSVARGSIELEANTWYHLAATWDGLGDGLMRIFVNGEEVDYVVQDTLFGPIDTDSTVTISSQNEGFVGRLDDLAIFEQATIAPLIAGLFHAGLGDGVGDACDNCPTVWSFDQADCDMDGVGDVCAVAEGVDDDCNANDVPDRCDIISGTSMDDDGSGIPDECEVVLCETHGDCADLDGDGIRDDGCLFWACEAGTCVETEILFADMGGQFGECPVDGTADGNDRFHALNCFANTDPDSGGAYMCEDNAPQAFNVDAGGQFGSCSPDGVCDGNDAFAALNAFAGTTSCSCPLDGAPAPLAPTQPVIADEVVVELVPSVDRAATGDVVEVDVYITGGVSDLRGYQLHTTSSRGLELIDIVVEHRQDHAFAHEASWEAYNLETEQVLVGIDTEGIASKGDLYLATLVYKVRGSDGTARVDLLHDDTDPTQRTFLFATERSARIEITAVEPALFMVNGDGLGHSKR